MHTPTLRLMIGLTAVVSSLGFSGCMHDTLYFGTNTVVGLKIGVDHPSNMPVIQLAHAREEVVVLPLLVKDVPSTATHSTDGKLIEEKPVIAINSTIDSAKYVGTDKDQSKDTYSVMASFGLNVDGSKPGVGISQYFATGLAARELSKHGAALVSTSDSAIVETSAVALAEGKEILSNAQKIGDFVYGPDNKLNSENFNKVFAGTELAGRSNQFEWMSSKAQFVRDIAVNHQPAVDEGVKNVPAN